MGDEAIMLIRRVFRDTFSCFPNDEVLKKIMDDPDLVIDRIASIKAICKKHFSLWSLMIKELDDKDSTENIYIRAWNFYIKTAICTGENLLANFAGFRRGISLDKATEASGAKLLPNGMDVDLFSPEVAGDLDDPYTLIYNMIQKKGFAKPQLISLLTTFALDEEIHVVEKVINTQKARWVAEADRIGRTARIVRAISRFENEVEKARDLPLDKDA